MSKIALAKQNIDLREVIEQSGVELTDRGHRSFGLCPFHIDSNASFYIFDDGYYHCFGCQAHGDVITYVQKRYGLNFPEALKFLGIEKDPIPKTRIMAQQKERQELEQCKQRESDLAYTLGTLIRWTQQAMCSIQTIDDLEQFADLLHALPFWKHCHLILCDGDPSDRREMVEALKDMETISRNKLFRPDFDFPGWLRNFINGVQINETQKRIKVSFE
jgi:hypothetical protein